MASGIKVAGFGLGLVVTLAGMGAVLLLLPAPERAPSVPATAQAPAIAAPGPLASAPAPQSPAPLAPVTGAQPPVAAPDALAPAVTDTAPIVAEDPAASIPAATDQAAMGLAAQQPGPDAQALPGIPAATDQAALGLAAQPPAPDAAASVAALAVPALPDLPVPAVTDAAPTVAQAPAAAVPAGTDQAALGLRAQPPVAVQPVPPSRVPAEGAVRDALPASDMAPPAPVPAPAAREPEAGVGDVTALPDTVPATDAAPVAQAARDTALVADPLPADAPQADQTLRDAPDQSPATIPPAPDSPPSDSPAPDSPATAPSMPVITPLPGRPVVTGMPGQPVRRPAEPDLADSADLAPRPADAAQPDTALIRNAVLVQPEPGRPLMALVLADPGLPMAERLALAARPIPFTVALNPMDPTAPDAAALYLENGKEVFILASGLPNGATASDVEVTFSAFFATLPQAAGVIDLPRDGFTRNARLMGDVMQVVGRDGYGLVTFAGGLGNAARAAQDAGIRHTEVFRVLDANEESPFTIRRFLDRAVFQATQMGQVVVYGEASSTGLLQALDMWLTDGQADQVATVPVSGILLAE